MGRVCVCVCVERGCPRPNSHVPQIHPQKKVVLLQETKILSKKSYDKYGHSQPILTLILTLFF
jgi:hypothetical protein